MWLCSCTQINKKLRTFNVLFCILCMTSLFVTSNLAGEACEMKSSELLWLCLQLFVLSAEFTGPFATCESVCCSGSHRNIPHLYILQSSFWAEDV